MKKKIYKIFAIFLSFLIFSYSVIFSTFSINSYCDIVTDTLIESLISSLVGYVFNDAVDAGREFGTWLFNKKGIDIFNDGNIEDYGLRIGDGKVEVSEEVEEDLTEFVNDYKQDNPDFRYCYSIDFKRWSNAFVSRARYQSILNLLNQYPNDVFVFYTYYGVTSDPTGTNDNNSIQQGGDRAIRIYRLSNEFSCFVLNSDISGFFSVYPYNDDWQKLKYSSSTIYGFAQQGDTNLSVVGLPSYYDETIDFTAIDADKNAYPLGGGNGFWSPYGNTFYVIHSSPHGYPMYRTTDIMKQYSLGNQPYYIVPTNPNVTYDNGYYSVTTTQLDNSISYGDISTYVSTNNVTDYNVVNNYINNYYYNNGGGNGNGSGGDNGNGSGGDSNIDWGWLGNIGEVIGGLISALGNVIAGVIDAIASLIESLTVNLPNTLGQLIAWLIPFLPEEVTTLLGAFFMVVVIIGVIKLLRR